MEAATLNPPLPLQALASQMFGDALAIPLDQAAAALSCSRSQVNRLIQRGELQGVALNSGKKAGRRVTVLSLLNFISNGGSMPEDKMAPAARLAADQRARNHSDCV